ncbi:hypothetical protein [Aridibaculum aurantiacum]|uniref:hypothetical protein n=1 Tax=Aridibaculum aurantiacum TaxID=2810307 RepID=UPI001A9766B9|nr:hypothetical protein [Aridibaculum aurantiacum]
MKIYFYAVILVAITSMAGSCKKNTDATASANFGPLTAGSSWTYRSTTDGGPPSNYTITATNRDTQVNNRTYRVLTTSTGENQYRNKSGNEYYDFGTITDLNVQLEQLYLKDNAAVNATWKSTVPFTVPQFPVTFTATMLYTIKEKGISRTVNGVNFSNVIRVGLDVSVEPSIGKIVDADMYYAAGVGLIESRYVVQSIPLAGISGSTTTEVLTSYTIK